MIEKKILTQKQKILVIEYYLTHKSNGLKSIAMDLGLSYETLTRYVKAYEKTGFLVLRSKMN